MERGDIVSVVEYGGRKLTRRVIADRGEVIDVCNEEEYRRALAESREPRGIGFRCDVVRILESPLVRRGDDTMITVKADCEIQSCCRNCGRDTRTNVQIGPTISGTIPLCNPCMIMFEAKISTYFEEFVNT